MKFIKILAVCAVTVGSAVLCGCVYRINGKDTDNTQSTNTVMCAMTPETYVWENMNQSTNRVNSRIIK